MKGQRINCANRKFNRFTPYQGESTEDLLKSVDSGAGFLCRTGEDGRITRMREYTTRMCKNFVKSFHHNMRKELAATNYQKFHDDCKDRSSDLSLIRERLSRLSNVEGFFFLPRGGEDVLDISQIQYFGKGGKFLAVSEEDVNVVNTIKVQPYWYASLYKAMFSSMQLYIELKAEKDEVGAASVMQIALQVESWGKIYNELRCNKSMTLEHEHSMFAALSGDKAPALSEDSELLECMHQVIADIREGTKPYVLEISNALKHIQRREFRSSFQLEDFYVSGKATSYRHRKDELKISIISSGIETDPLKDHVMDSVIGYKSAYNVKKAEVEDDSDFITLTILQNKMKPRVIHIACNAIQDRAKYMYRVLSSMLSEMSTDCIDDQRSGIAFAERVSNPVFRANNGWPSILCMDFSNATDLLSQEFQNEVLGLVFPKEVVSFWRDISSREKTFIFSDGTKKKYSQNRGQPQGLLGSIHGFALAHHVIMLMVMRMTGRTNLRASQFYRILGDDSIICSHTSDPEGLVQAFYERVCAWVGLEINIGKSHIVGYRDRESALCEFAKVTVLNGKMSTPVPIRLLSRVGKTSGRYSKNYYKLTTLMWMQSNGYDYLKDEIHGYLPLCFSKDAVPIASDMIRAGIIPAFSMFADYKPVSGDWLSKAMFCYLVEQIKGSFLSALLKDKASEDVFSEGAFDMEKISPFLVEPEKLQAVLDLVEDSNHKINYVLQRNLDLEDSLKIILGISNTEKRLISGAVDLTTEEIRLYVWVADILQNIELGIEIPAQSREEWMSLLRAAASLDRFMPRSFHKKTPRDIIFLEKAIQRLFNTFGVPSEYADAC